VYDAVLQRDARGKPRVWICRDKESGRPRGDGIVGYDLPQAASLAIERFHSKMHYDMHCVIFIYKCVIFIHKLLS